jgi:hypothetical protein
VICPQCHCEGASQDGDLACPRCGIVSCQLKSGLIIYSENLATHRASGESAQRRRWYSVARIRWLSGRNAPRVQEC